MRIAYTELPAYIRAQASGSGRAIRFRMKLSLLLLVLSGASLAACAVPYSNYVATDGTVLHNVEPADALRVSAARDLACEPDRVNVYQLAPRVDGGMVATKQVARGNRFALDVGEGCGQRVVYKQTCGPMNPMLPPAASPEEARSREWKVGAQDERACRHLLVSRVALDPNAPMAGLDLE